MPATMHLLPLHRRAVGLVFPLLILVFAGATTPTFIEVGLPWWPLFIFGLPGLLAILIAVEYWNVAIAFDATGIHYRSVGYAVSAPWGRVSEHDNGRSVSLHVDQCEPQYYWWLWPMQVVLAAFMPGRARYAHGLMALIPLWWFSTAPDDAVMSDYARTKNISETST